MLLEGLASTGQKLHRVAGKRLKLHVAGTAAEAGAVSLAISGAFHQPVKIGGDLLIELHPVFLQLGHIPEGFVHHKNDVGLLHGPITLVFVAARKLRAQILTGSLIQNLLHRFLAVSFGFIHLQVLNIGQKAGDNAIIAVVTVLHPHIRRDPHQLGNRGIDEYAEHQHKRTRCRNSRGQRPCAECGFRLPNKAGQHKQHGENYPADPHGGLQLQTGLSHHIAGFRNLRQIPGKERLAPQFQLIICNRRRDATQRPGDQNRQRMQPCGSGQGLINTAQQQPGEQECRQVRQNILGEHFRGKLLTPMDPFGAHKGDQAYNRSHNQPQCTQPPDYSGKV